MISPDERAEFLARCRRVREKIRAVLVAVDENTAIADRLVQADYAVGRAIALAELEVVEPMPESESVS